MGVEMCARCSDCSCHHMLIMTRRTKTVKSIRSTHSYLRKRHPRKVSEQSEQHEEPSRRPQFRLVVNRRVVPSFANSLLRYRDTMDRNSPFHHNTQYPRAIPCFAQHQPLTHNMERRYRTLSCANTNSISVSAILADEARFFCSFQNPDSWFAKNDHSTFYST